MVLPETVVVPGTGELDAPRFGRPRPGFTRTQNGVFAFASFAPGVHRVSATEWGHPRVDREYGHGEVIVPIRPVFLCRQGSNPPQAE